MSNVYNDFPAMMREHRIEQAREELIEFNKKRFGFKGFKTLFELLRKWGKK
jgi:hypothetical protein